LGDPFAEKDVAFCGLSDVSEMLAGDSSCAFDLDSVDTQRNNPVLEDALVVVGEVWEVVNLCCYFSFWEMVDVLWYE